MTTTLVPRATAAHLPGLLRTAVGAFFLPFIAIPCAIYGASFGMTIASGQPLVLALTPLVLLVGLYFFPLTILAAIGGWVGATFAFGICFATRLLSPTRTRVIVTAVGTAVLIATGAVLGLVLPFTVPDPFGVPGPVANPITTVGVLLAVFLGTLVPALCLTTLTTVLTTVIWRRPRGRPDLTAG